MKKTLLFILFCVSIACSNKQNKDNRIVMDTDSIQTIEGEEEIEVDMQVSFSISDANNLLVKIQNNTAADINLNHEYSIDYYNGTWESIKLKPDLQAVKDYNLTPGESISIKHSLQLESQHYSKGKYRLIKTFLTSEGKTLNSIAEFELPEISMRGQTLVLGIDSLIND